MLEKGARAYRLEDGLPHRWRELDDTDIKQILDAVPKGLRSRADHGVMKTEINGEIDELADVVLRFRISKPPHVELRKLRKLRVSLLRTIECLRNLEGLWFGLDDACRQLSQADLDAFQVLIPARLWEDPLAPSRFDDVVDGFKILRVAIAACETALEQQQDATNSKKAPKQHDYVRYEFVDSLAHIFESSFKVRATQNPEGPWCTFLAAVLSRCEDKEITNEAALFLWKSLRKTARLRNGAVHRECARYVVGGQRQNLPQDWSARIASEDIAVGGHLLWGLRPWLWPAMVERLKTAATHQRAPHQCGSRAR